MQTNKQIDGLEYPTHTDRQLDAGLTQDDELSGELSGWAACWQLVAAVAASIFQSHATDGQLTTSTRVVSADVMPCRELWPQCQASVDDLRLVARRWVEVPTERRTVGTTFWVTAKLDVRTDYDGCIHWLIRRHRRLTNDSDCHWTYS